MRAIVSRVPSSASLLRLPFFTKLNELTKTKIYKIKFINHFIFNFPNPNQILKKWKIIEVNFLWKSHLYFFPINFLMKQLTNKYWIFRCILFSVSSPFIVYSLITPRCHCVFWYICRLLESIGRDRRTTKPGRTVILTPVAEAIGVQRGICDKNGYVS